jgi:preprotein translocase subunit SecF
MTKVLKFSKFRFTAPIISVLIVTAGLLITLLGTGVNLGIDFDAGINVRLQVAPIAFRVSYTGEGAAEMNIRGDVLALEITEAETSVRHSIAFSDVTTLGALMGELDAIDGITTEAVAPSATESAQLLTLNYPYVLGLEPMAINKAPEDGSADIDTVRSVLGDFGSIQIQMIGAALDQEFQVRVAEEEGARDFDQEVAGRLRSALEAEFGDGTVLIRQTDYVGARLSQNLAQQTVYLSVLALVLILVYVWFRFKLAYAVSAIAALVHDTLFMFAFVGVVGMEFSTATIAAILTIIGYSLNDTIVIFDRVRENTGLMRNASIKEITDTSISQSLSRTLMTSLTTLLAVLALYIFGTGSIKDFALAVIFGVLVGTFSSLFIAAPLFMAWMNAIGRRKRTRDAERYGTKADLKKEDRQASEAGPRSETPSSSSSSSSSSDEIPTVDRKLKGKRKGK